MRRLAAQQSNYTDSKTMQIKSLWSQCIKGLLQFVMNLRPCLCEGCSLFLAQLCSTTLKR